MEKIVKGKKEEISKERLARMKGSLRDMFAQGEETGYLQNFVV